MADFFNKFKKTLDKGVNTVSIKSNTLMEINKVKSNINILNQEVQKQKNALSSTFYKMYLHNEIDIEACKTFCLKIQELEEEIKVKEEEIEEIKQKEEALLEGSHKKIEKEEVHLPITPQVNRINQTEAVTQAKEQIEQQEAEKILEEVTGVKEEIESTSKMRVCTCGQVIEDGVKFCSGCGKKII